MGSSDQFDINILVFLDPFVLMGNTVTLRKIINQGL